MQNGTQPKRRKLLLIFWIIAIPLMLLFTANFVYRVYSDFQRDPLRSPLSWIALLMGAFAFYARQKARKIYGLVEFFLGWTITVFAATSSLHNFRSILDIDVKSLVLSLNWAATISGIYFIVRVMDNIGKSFKNEKMTKDTFNKSIDESWKKLVEAEAHRLWIQKGRRLDTNVSDWEEAEHNVGRRKKDVSLANAWLRVFGSD